MDWLSRLSRRRRDDEITEEIESHLRMAIQDRMERGEEAEQARLAAQREFGNVALVADATRRIWTSTTLETPIVAMRTMTSQLDTVTELERMVATLLMFFAAGSLAVAALGQYAITTFNMRRRARDFGIRLALGASSQQVQRAVVREAFQLTATGLLIGFALSAAAGAAFKRVLFGIAPTDPLTYTGVFTLLAAASVLASYLPAWRAGRVNVIEALRQD